MARNDHYYNLIPTCDRCKKAQTVLEETFSVNGITMILCCIHCGTQTRYFADFSNLIDLAIRYGSTFEVNEVYKN